MDVKMFLQAASACGYKQRSLYSKQIMSFLPLALSVDMESITPLWKPHSHISGSLRELHMGPQTPFPHSLLFWPFSEFVLGASHGTNSLQWQHCHSSGYSGCSNLVWISFWSKFRVYDYSVSLGFLFCWVEEVLYTVRCYVFVWIS